MLPAISTGAPMKALETPAKLAEAVKLAVGAGLPTGFVTEDTIRSRPETLSTLFRNAIEHGVHDLLCGILGCTLAGVHFLLA